MVSIELGTKGGSTLVEGGTTFDCGSKLANVAKGKGRQRERWTEMGLKGKESGIWGWIGGEGQKKKCWCEIILEEDSGKF